MTAARRISTIMSPRTIVQHDQPCRKCGNTPTKLIMRGPIMVERQCVYCGHIQFYDTTPAAA